MSRSSHYGHRTSAGSREGKDYTQDPAYILQRRTLIRRYHPDRGGDAQVFIRKLDELDREWADRYAPTPRPTTSMGAKLQPQRLWRSPHPPLDAWSSAFDG